jgi:hypothetical protein
MAYSKELCKLLPEDDRSQLEWKVTESYTLSVPDQMDAFFAGREYIYSLGITKHKFLIIYSGCAHLLKKISDLKNLYNRLSTCKTYVQMELVNKDANRESTFITKIDNTLTAKGFAMSNSDTLTSNNSISQASGRTAGSDSGSYNPTDRDE